MYAKYLHKKTLITGFVVAVVITGIVLYGQSTGTPTPDNLSAVTERAVDIANTEIVENPTVAEVTATDTATATEVVATPETVTKPVVEAKPAPAPVVTAPVSAAPITPAPQPEPTPASGITKTEVAVHNNAQSCWSIINGGVYDLTSYIPRHPGGKSEILAICGKDGTRLFEGQHSGDSKPERILAGFFLADLVL